MYTPGVPGFLINIIPLFIPPHPATKKKSWQIDYACRSAGGAVQIDYFTRVEASYCSISH